MEKIKVEAIRGQLGYTKEKMAKFIGITINTYNKKISKESEWKLSEIMKIADSVGLKVEQIEY